MTELPHCPMCGFLPKLYVNQLVDLTHKDCNFMGVHSAFHPKDWRQAVRFELARQALELRAHNVASDYPMRQM